MLEKEKFDDQGRRKIALTQLQPGEQGAPQGQRMTRGTPRTPRAQASLCSGCLGQSRLIGWSRHRLCA